MRFTLISTANALITTNDNFQQLMETTVNDPLVRPFQGTNQPGAQPNIVRPRGVGFMGGIGGIGGCGIGPCGGLVGGVGIARPLIGGVGIAHGGVIGGVGIAHGGVIGGPHPLQGTGFVGAQLSTQQGPIYNQMHDIRGNPNNLPGGSVAVGAARRGMIHNGPQVYNGNGRFYALEAAHTMLTHHLHTLFSIKSQINNQYGVMKTRLMITTQITAKNLINKALFKLIKNRAQVNHQIYYCRQRLRILKAAADRAEYYLNGNSYYENR